MSLSSLPVELLEEIIDFALDDHPVRNDILRVNKTFLQLGQPLLHAHLQFQSLKQLIRFSQGTTLLACAPRSLEVYLAGASGGAAIFDAFQHLESALQRCLRSVRALRLAQKHGRLGSPPGDKSAEDKGDDAIAQVPLELLSFCLHSHNSNPNLHYIYEALSLVNPRTFVWKGPDPEHHFSTAIVPAAMGHLVRALPAWSALEHLTLVNIAFPSDGLGLHTPWSPTAPLLPPLPRLCTLYIGMATFFPPGAIAAMLARPGLDALACVRLVDAYRHSIWGPRVRMRDIEDAVGLLVGLEDEERGRVVEKVKVVVRCEKKTERIQGGDNGDQKGLLN